MLFNFQENIGTPLCSLSLAFKNQFSGTSLEAQWLGLGISAAGDLGSIPGWGNKILQTSKHSKKKKNQNFLIF